MSAMLRVLLLLIAAASLASAREYFVSANTGSDDNPGTEEQPWQRVQRAVSAPLRPGDTVTLRQGVYHEEVALAGVKGTPEAPITFRAYPGEKVVFDGSFPVQGSDWKLYKEVVAGGEQRKKGGGESQTGRGSNVTTIYWTQLESDMWQLFVDGNMQVNARWPNAFWHDYSVFDYTLWGFSSKDSTFDLEMATGVMIDNGTQDLAGAKVNATGAIAILNIGQWMTWAGKVTQHQAGSDTFKYALDGGENKPKAVHFIAQHCRYFLEDKLEFLDAPSEWFYDQHTKKLYLGLASSPSDRPEKHDIRGKNSTYAFIISAASSWIKLSGLEFFATTVYARGEFGNADVSNIVLDSCRFTYPSYSRRMLGSLALPNTTTLYHNAELTPHAGNFTVRNCVWEYADGQTIDYRGADGVFENNLWHHNDFSCVGDGALFQSKGVRETFVRNTVHSNGPSVGFAPGIGQLPEQDRLSMSAGSDVRLNWFYDLKYLQNDGAHIQTMVPAQNGTTLTRNWCGDTMKLGMRFDRINKDNVPWGYNGTMSQNVVWGNAGIMIKGNHHRCLNNLAFDNTGYYDIALYGNSGDGVRDENTLTTTAGNVLQHGACSTQRDPPPNCPGVPGNFTDNFVGDVFTALRDPENLDFRPIDGSPLLDKNLGPYSAASTKHGGTYWIPGRQESFASVPVPPNGTDTARCDAHLMWLAGYGASAHNVYLSTDYERVSVSNASVFIGTMAVPGNVVDPSVRGVSLQAGTRYYWRVDTIPGPFPRTVVGGTVWNFKCKK